MNIVKTVTDELEAEYALVNGVIQNPGKFEGCKRYVPYYWDIGMNGGSDFDDGVEFRFNVTPEDIAIFPELEDRKRVTLIFNDQGFVYEIGHYREA